MTGDIADGRTVAECLCHLRESFEGPVHFVLGNHDYYRAHFRTVDEDVLSTSRRTDGLNWLREGAVLLDEGTVLTGSGGFYDARYGNPDSPLQLSDFMLIGEIFEALDESQARMHALLQERADSLMNRFRTQVLRMLTDPKIRNVIVATHVPPFAEAAWYRGKGADGTWAPYFASKATGDTLLQLAADFPHVTFTTLCGHSHGDGFYSAAPNLPIYTGRAHYGFPALAGLLTFDTGSQVSVTLFASPENKRR